MQKLYTAQIIDQADFNKVLWTGYSLSQARMIRETNIRLAMIYERTEEEWRSSIVVEYSTANLI